MSPEVFWEIMAQPAKAYGIHTAKSIYCFNNDSYEKFANGKVIKLTAKWTFCAADHTGPVQIYVDVETIKQVTVEPLEWPPDAALMVVDEKNARWEEI